MSRGDCRSKFFSFLIYPDTEGLPEFWRERIDSLQVPWVVSPLHDKDIYLHSSEHPDWEVKKPHFHCLIDFGALKTINNVEKIFAGADMLEFLPKGMPFIIPPSKPYAVRYMLHLDSKPYEESGKYKYSADDLDCRNGFDASNFLGDVVESQVDLIIDEMIDFVVEHEVREYKQLLLYARKYEPEWKKALYHSCTYVIKAFMQSVSSSFGQSFEIKGCDEYNESLKY